MKIQRAQIIYKSPWLTIKWHTSSIGTLQHGYVTQCVYHNKCIRTNSIQNNWHTSQNSTTHEDSMHTFHIHMSAAMDGQSKCILTWHSSPSWSGYIMVQCQHVHPCVQRSINIQEQWHTSQNSTDNEDLINNVTKHLHDGPIDMQPRLVLVPITARRKGVLMSTSASTFGRP